MRLLHMYSFYVLLLAYARAFFGSEWLPWYVWDIVRAAAFLTTSAVVLFYAYAGFEGVKAFYSHLFFPMSAWAWVTFDVFVHFVPCALLGLSLSWWSYPIAFATMVIWFYGIAGPTFDSIYRVHLNPKVVEKTLWYVGVPVTALASMVTYYAGTKRGSI